MGEYRDMGNPAEVVKKKSCTSGEAASAGFAACAGFFFHHFCRISHVPKFAHTGMLYSDVLCNDLLVEAKVKSSSSEAHPNFQICRINAC
jgi:hypothetical protein